MPLSLIYFMCFIIGMYGQFWVALGCLIGFSIYFLDKKGIIFIIALLFSLLTWPKPDFNSAFKIIEVNEYQIVLTQNFIKYHAYVKQEQTFKENEIIIINGSYQAQDSISNSGFVGHIKIDSIISSQIDGSFNLLFLKTVELDSQVGRLLTSTGVIVSTFIHLVLELYDMLIGKKKYRQWVLIGSLILLIFTFGLTLAVFRWIVKGMVSNSKQTTHQKVIFEMTLVLMVFQNSLLTLGFLIPYAFRLGSFIINKKHSKWFLVQLIIWLNTGALSLLNILLLPILRRLIKYGMLTCIILWQPLEKFLLWIDSWLLWLEPFDFILKGGLNWFTFLIIMIAMIGLLAVEYKQMILLVLLIVVSTLFNVRNEIIFLDVGQGDATLILDKDNNQVLLVDTGPPSSYYNLKKKLNLYKVYEIDYLIITHNDIDHNGNLDKILADFPVHHVIDQKGKLQNHPRLLEYLSERVYSNDNDNSLIFKTDFEDDCVLLLGDISKEVERDLVADQPALDCDFVKLAHHGSKTSSDQYFLDEVNAKIAIISSDPRKYGHPHRETLVSLDNLDIVGLQTSKMGDIHLLKLWGFWLFYSDFHWVIVL